MRLGRLERLAGFWWDEIGLQITIQQIARLATQSGAQARQARNRMPYLF